MQDVEGVLFGAYQRGLKAGAQGYRSAGTEQQKADNHHSERESVTSLSHVVLLNLNTAAIFREIEWLLASSAQE